MITELNTPITLPCWAVADFIMFVQVFGTKHMAPAIKDAYELAMKELALTELALQKIENDKNAN